MPSISNQSPSFKPAWVALMLLAGTLVPAAIGQDPPAPQTPPAAPQAATPAAPQAAAKYKPTIFEGEIDSEQLAFLQKFDGAPSGDLYRDLQFRKLLKGLVPDCIIHFVRDRALNEVLDSEFAGSKVPVEIRGDRYVLVSGSMGKVLGGHAFLWIDMEDGIGLGGIAFTPADNEPAPVMDVFSRQVKEEYLAMSDLPPDFADDLIQWSTANDVPPVTARYFLTAGNKRILLEHDEDFCREADGKAAPPDSGCRQTAVDAADMDLTEAYYLEATHHASNAAGWTPSQDQMAFVEIRDKMCRVGSDTPGCKIRMTRERTSVVVKRGSTPPKPVRH